MTSIEKDAWLARNAEYTALSLYAVMALLTFGHCWTRMGVLPTGPFPPELLIFKLIITALCAIFWPLYLSVHVWTLI